MVTNFETYKKLKPLGMVDYKLIENKTKNLTFCVHELMPVNQAKHLLNLLILY